MLTFYLNTFVDGGGCLCRDVPSFPSNGDGLERKGTPPHKVYVKLGLHELLQQLDKYGLPGLFLVSFLSNAIPGFPAIYLAIIGAYALINPNPGEAIAAILISGIGAGLGKILVFMSSRAVGKASTRLSRLREKTEWLSEEAQRGVFILVFLFAALPLPDDLLYIPLGLTGFKAVSFAIAVITGKIVLTGIVYFLGKAYRSAFQAFTSSPPTSHLELLVGGAIIASILITIIIFKINWELIYKTYRREGSMKATLVLIKEFIKVISFNMIMGERKMKTLHKTVIVIATMIGLLVGWHFRELLGAGLLGFTGYELGCMTSWILNQTKNIPGATPKPDGDEEDSGR